MFVFFVEKLSYPANKSELSERFANIPIKLWKRYFRMFCTLWKRFFFLCIKNVFVEFLRTLQEHSILPLWKHYENVITECFIHVQTPVFFMFEEHSNLPLS